MPRPLAMTLAAHPPTTQAQLWDHLRMLAEQHHKFWKCEERVGCAVPRHKQHHVLRRDSGGSSTVCAGTFANCQSAADEFSVSLP